LDGTVGFAESLSGRVCVGDDDRVAVVVGAMMFQDLGNEPLVEGLVALLGDLDRFGLVLSENFLRVEEELVP
jgi:hypothetical protein